MPPPPPQQAALARRRSRDGWTTLCWVVLVLFATGIVVLITWLSTPPHGPRFAVASLSISGGHVAFNVSNSDPNRHYGISYKGATRASLLLDGATVASGQANMNTTSVTGVLDVVDGRSFSTELRGGGGRLPLLLQLTTPISFRPPSVEHNMQVSCDLLVGASGRLLRESVGMPCNTYFWQLDDD